MMSIPDKNETIYQVIYTALNGGFNSKALKEFGFYTYFVLPEENFGCKLNFFIFNFIFSFNNGFLSIGFQSNL